MTGREGTFRCTLYTNPLSHRVARTIALAGRRFGLTVEHDHDRAWFDRTNLITATGPEKAIVAYSRYVQRVQDLWEADEREST